MCHSHLWAFQGDISYVASFRTCEQMCAQKPGLGMREAGVRFWLTSALFKVKARDGPCPREEVWVVSSRTSQNVTIEETPVHCKSTQKPQVERGLQFSCLSSFCFFWRKNLCQSGMEGTGGRMTGRKSGRGEL